MIDQAKIATAVIGVGYLGKFHAEKYAGSEKANLVAVADIDKGRAESIANQLGVAAFTDYRELLGRVRCVSVAVPTRLHFEIASYFLKRGVDVLVEKPIAADIHQGRELVDLAGVKGLILQVGHLERFNPAIRRLENVIQERGTDVDVVLDLMIHDIDVIASLVRSTVDRVEDIGVAVLTDKPDIANARITFSNGCIANVTASRVSIKRERKIRFFQPDAYLSIDYDQRRAQIFHKPPTGGGWMDIRAETIEIKEADALADEIDSFLDCVRTRSLPLVSGAEGLRALEIASMISGQL